MEGLKYNPKSNHFFMQLKNLVDKKSEFIIQVNRLLQIAFNAGQLSVFIEEKEIPEDIIEFIKTYNLLSIDTYVSDTNQEIINKKLKSIKLNLVGGFTDYYSKYKKYKMKYMKLKSFQ
jgi:hypothetical protein